MHFLVTMNWSLKSFLNSASTCVDSSHEFLPLNHRSDRVDVSWSRSRCTVRCSRNRSQPPPPHQRWWSSARCCSPARLSPATRSRCDLDNYCLQTGSGSRGSSDVHRPSDDLHILQTNRIKSLKTQIWFLIMHLPIETTRGRYCS